MLKRAGLHKVWYMIPLKNCGFETTVIVSLIPICDRILIKLLTLHITWVRNQTEHLLGMLFLIGLEPFHLLSSCVKASLNIKQKLTTESYMLWFSLNTSDEEEFSCQTVKYFLFPF